MLFRLDIDVALAGRAVCAEDGARHRHRVAGYEEQVRVMQVHCVLEVRFEHDFQPLGRIGGRARAVQSETSEQTNISESAVIGELDCFLIKTSTGLYRSCAAQANF